MRESVCARVRVVTPSVSKPNIIFTMQSFKPCQLASHLFVFKICFHLVRWGGDASCTYRVGIDAFFKKKNPPPPSRAPPPSFLPSLPPCVINITGFSEKAKEMFWMSWQIFKECIGVGEGRGGVRLGFVFFFCLLLLVCFWGVLAKGEVTDQCCKVYRLHVIVTAVTAIVLFLLFLCFLPRQWSVGTGMHKTLFLFMIFTRVLCIFAFATKKLNFCVIRKREFVWFFFFPNMLFHFRPVTMCWGGWGGAGSLLADSVCPVFASFVCTVSLFS